MGIFDKQLKNNITFSDVAQEWLLYKQPILKKSTLSYYKYIIDIRLNSILGDEKVSKLKDYNFNNITIKMQEKLGNNSTRDTLSVLKSILRYMDLKYNLGLNVDLIAIPKLATRNIEVFTKEETETLENYLKQSERNIEIGIWISLYAGIKIGEVCALKWKDINLKNRAIIVRNVVQSIRKKEKNYYTIVDEVNTEYCNSRIVPISNQLYEKLNSMKTKNNKNNYILTNSETRIMFPSSYRKVFNRVLKKCGIKHKKYQALRHTFAMHCIALGMDVETLKEILGHTQVSTTVSTYMNPSIQTKQDYLNKLYK